MKKVIIYLLIFAFALSLVACGDAPSQAEKLYEKYEDLISAIENEDYATAQKEMDRFFDKIQINGGTNEETGEGDSTENVETPETQEDPNFVRLRDIMVSEWIPQQDSDVTAFGRISITEDGLCNINGENLSWEVASASDRGGQVTVLRNGERAYQLNVNYAEEGYYFFTMYECMGNDMDDKYLFGKVYRADGIQEIVITMDNWQDYFIFKEKLFIEYNAFGEPDTGIVRTYLMLNPDIYKYVLEDLSHIAIEYKAAYGTAKVDVDMEAQDWEYSYIYSELSEHTVTYKMHAFDVDDIEAYGDMVCGSFGIDLPHDDNVSWEVFLELLRIQGSIYYIAK